jgi:D-erythro-7,8-dihydroneopterin triphosphate epimerase
MTTIRIDNLRLRTLIGVYQWEQDHAQEVIINISFDYDANEAAATDEISKAVDYKAMKLRIMDLVENGSFALLERLAQDILSTVIEEPLIASATVRVDKPGALRFADSVSAEVSHCKKPHLLEFRDNRHDDT